MKSALVEATSKAKNTHMGMREYCGLMARLRDWEVYVQGPARDAYLIVQGVLLRGQMRDVSRYQVLRILLVFFFESSLFKSSVWCESATLVKVGKDKSQRVK